MWSFSVGLYLVFFENGVLLLAAALTFTRCSALWLLGGILGNWVDCNPRLKGDEQCQISLKRSEFFFREPLVGV